MKRKCIYAAAVIFAAMMVTSCAPSVKLIGSLNVISTRNFDTSQEYVPLKTYAGGTKADLKEAVKTRCQTVEDAINVTVKNVPGGEYMQNVKIWLVEDIFFAAEGDVWGIKDAVYRGMKIGDKIKYKYIGKYLSGTISSFIGSEKVLIMNEDGKEVEVDIEDVHVAE